MDARGVRSTSSRVSIHRATRQPRCASLSPPIISVGHAPDAARLHKPIHGDQPDAAMRAKRGLLPSRRGMAVFRACRSGLIGIHRSATLGTVANGRVIAAMIEIGTGRARVHSHLVTHACKRAVQRRHRAVVTPIRTAYPPAFPHAVSKCTSRPPTCWHAMSPCTENIRGAPML
jgi:hypothetical protein